MLTGMCDMRTCMCRCADVHICISAKVQAQLTANLPQKLKTYYDYGGKCHQTTYKHIHIHST